MINDRWTDRRPLAAPEDQSLRSGVVSHITYIILAMVLSTLMFMGLNWLGQTLTRSWDPSPYQTLKYEERFFLSLQDWVRQNNVTETNTWVLNEFMQAYPNEELELVVAGEPIYQSKGSDITSKLLFRANNYKTLDQSNQHPASFPEMPIGQSMASVRVVFHHELRRFDNLRPLLWAVAILTFWAVSYAFIRRDMKAIDRLITWLKSLDESAYSEPLQIQEYRQFGELAQALEAHRRRHLSEETQEGIRVKEHRSLIRNMAHDLRTPLTALIGYLEILVKQHEGLTEERKLEYLSNAHAKAIHLRTSTNEVFEHFLLEARGKEQTLTLMDGSIYFMQLLELIDADLEAMGFELEMDLTDEPFYVRIDPAMMERVVNNLLNNISRYGDPEFPCKLSIQVMGTERLRINTSIHKHHQGMYGYVYLTLKNAKAKTPQTRQSAGIGLANVTQIMEAHGGYLRVTDEKRDFTVRLILPLAQPDSEGQ